MTGLLPVILLFNYKIKLHKLIYQIPEEWWDLMV